MRTYLDCIPCFIRQGLEAARSVCKDEDIIARTLKRVLAETATFDLTLSPPEMGQKIHQIIREETGNKDPYREIKDTSIALALTIEKRVKKIVNDSGDPFENALRFSIAGNILDFALLSTWDDSRIEESFDAALIKKINKSVVKELKEEMFLLLFLFFVIPLHFVLKLLFLYLLIYENLLLLNAVYIYRIEDKAF